MCLSAGVTRGYPARRGPSLLVAWPHPPASPVATVRRAALPHDASHETQAPLRLQIGTLKIAPGALGAGSGAYTSPVTCPHMIGARCDARNTRGLLTAPAAMGLPRGRLPYNAVLLTVMPTPITKWCGGCAGSALRTGVSPRRICPDQGSQPPAYGAATGSALSRCLSGYGASATWRGGLHRAADSAYSAARGEAVAVDTAAARRLGYRKALPQAPIHDWPDTHPAFGAHTVTLTQPGPVRRRRQRE